MKELQFTQEEKRILGKVHEIENLEMEKYWIDTNLRKWFKDMKKLLLEVRGG